MADLEGGFYAALAAGDTRAAVAALLDLDGVVEARIRAGEDSPDLDNATSTLRALIVRLGEAAAAGGSAGGAGGSVEARRATVAPFVDALLAVRAGARETRDWATADLVRDRLIEAGVEVRDGTDGSTWELAG
jgi:cysteinyl-tRNA synthetase